MWFKWGQVFATASTAMTMMAAPAADARARALPPVSALVVNAYTGATLYADAPGTVRRERLARRDAEPRCRLARRRA